MSDQSTQGAIPFRAETRQLLNILIHSLYTEREVFLRELISNASDALTRMSFETLTNRSIVDPEAELAIWITADPTARTLTMRDTGVGMTREELVENLGTIAHSGAKAFLQAAQEKKAPVTEIIGQFGVGFYSAFMVAESIRVVSRSFQPEAEAAAWQSTGEDTYTLEAAEKTTRGTEIVIHLKEDAAEFADIARLREIIRRHSDFIPYPIYLGDETQQANQRTALWRQSPREVPAEKANEFYRQFTLDFEPPLTYAHLSIDAPVQLYAMLFVPASPERNMFSLRKEEGLKLYARKVLIQEYSRDLLPEYFRFVQGVVDSEDLQLNVSREAIQSNRVISQLKRVLTGRVIEMLKKLAAEKQTPVKADAAAPTEAAAEQNGAAQTEAATADGQNGDSENGYAKFWKVYGRYLKEGIATDRDHIDALAPLLRFSSLLHSTGLISLDDYLAAARPDQKKIYYLLGEDPRSLVLSPHLDVFRHSGLDVLFMTDPVDAFVLMALTKYQDFELVSASAEKPDGPTAAPADSAQESPLAEDTIQSLTSRFTEVLGDRVDSVRSTDRLIDSPARLIDPEGAPNEEVQRVYRMLQREFEAPKKILEINPRHPILRKLSEQPDSAVAQVIIEQIYENALLIEGLHPDPASMIVRIQELMKAALQ